MNIDNEIVNMITCCALMVGAFSLMLILLECIMYLDKKKQDKEDEKKDPD